MTNTLKGHKDRVSVTYPIRGNHQESDFMNGTLQSSEDGKVDFTIQTFVPGLEGTIEEVARKLAEILRDLSFFAEQAGHHVSFDVQVGRGDSESSPHDDYENDPEVEGQMSVYDFGA